jgi:hypothetical protein
MKKLDHNELMKLYKDGEQADNHLYAEQRSNLLLVAGAHYARKGSRFWNRVRDDNRLSEEQKIRLTLNHIQRICKIYENNIISYAPSVAPVPKNGNELQDQKAAELNNAVWKDIKARHRWNDKIREIVQDFNRIGEVFHKVYWDENKGKIVDYAPAVDEMGQPILDEMGQPQKDQSKPVFSGDFVFERIFGFNVFRAKEAKSMQDSWFIGYRKMVNIDDLRARIGDDPEKQELIEASKDETYLIFDGNGSAYDRSQNECLLLEYYIRPSNVFPNGYYFITTLKGVLWEGELPFGKFPIIYAGMDEIPTSPRHYSIIKQLRPIQGEINRAISQVATHQITLGDDKLAVQAGTKVANGGLQPGVRVLSYSGQAPVVIPGRTGDQYIPYIDKMIQQFYVAANLEEEMAEKPSNLDPYTMLFMSIQQKKKFSVYTSKIEQYLIDFCETTLELAKQYYTEANLVPAIGRAELINIAEFKNTSPLFYQIRLEPGTEDMETRLGKQLTFNQIMQYVGSNLDPKDIGKIIRTSPYANNDLASEDLTMDFDNGTNIILALDRGQYMEPNMYDDKKYLIKRLTTRMRKADFKFLSPQIQQMYQQVLSKLMDMDAEEQRKIQEAAAGFIPMSGMAVVCDIYVPDPSNTSKTMRARVPYDALTWLLKRLEEQGASQQSILNQQQAIVAQTANRFIQSSPSQPQSGAVLPQPGVQPLLNPTQ